MDRNKRDERSRRRPMFSPDMLDFKDPNERPKRSNPVNFIDQFLSTSFPPPNYAAPPPAPSYSNQPISAAYPVTDSSYGQFSQMSYSSFGDIAPASMEMTVPDVTQPPPTPAWGPTPPAPNISAHNEQTKREAIASEVRNQRATLAKQKEEYLRKVNVLKRELDSLRNQRAELRGDSRRSPSPDSLRFLKENAKLQDEIQNKLKTMNNVIDMLDGIIGDKSSAGEASAVAEKTKRRKTRSSSHSGSSSRDTSPNNDKRLSRQKKRKSRSPSGEKKFNYVYYDPEMHWCRLCNEFPATAKEYLNHLHTPQHQRAAAAHMEAPWHNANQNEGMPNYPGAPSKRTPIKGLQFFVPSTAWYCKLCDQWIGDLHCASGHLKSLLHSQNYAKFVELNPHWEMDWMSDRQKNFEKSRKAGEGPPTAAAASSGANSESQPQYSPHTISFQPDGVHTKRKKDNGQKEDNAPPPTSSKKEKKSKKDKKHSKKKKRSSSDSSRSSSSSRSADDKAKPTKKKQSFEETGGWKPEKPDPASDDKMLSQWMSLQDDSLSEQDRKILENLKNRVKSRAGERQEQRVDGRVVSREREARELLAIRTERSRAEAQHSFRDDEKREKDRYRDKDRDRRKEKSYNNHGKASQEDFKPYLSGRRDNSDQNETRFDKQVAEKGRQKQTTNAPSISESKKMPFIGKMPLFKSLNSKPAQPLSKQETEAQKALSEEDSIEVARKKRDEINAQIQKSVAEFQEKFKSSMMKGELPEPGLALPTSLGALEPPTVVSGVSQAAAAIKKMPPVTFPQTIHKIQKKPTSFSAPPAPASPQSVQKPNKKSPVIGGKNDPLHKDFQDALDIIFPSENTPKPVEKALHSNGDNPMDQNVMRMSHIPPPNMGYQTMPPMMPPMVQQGYNPHMGQMVPNMAMMQGMPPPGMMMGYDYQGGMYGQPGLYDMQPPHVEPPPSKAPPAMSNEDMEDLALLGIDAEDVGAGGF